MDALPLAAAAPPAHYRRGGRRRSQAESIREDEAHVGLIAETLAPEPGAALVCMPPELRRSAVGLYLHLRQRGRSAQRAAFVVAYLYRVVPSTVTRWVGALN